MKTPPQDNPKNQQSELDEILKPLRRYSISIAFEQELLKVEAELSALLNKRIAEARIDENHGWAEVALNSKPTHYDFEDRIAQLKEDK